MESNYYEITCEGTSFIFTYELSGDYARWKLQASFLVVTVSQLLRTRRLLLFLIGYVEFRASKY